jgi:hypothetical protein
VIEDGTIDSNGKCYSSLSALGVAGPLYSEPGSIRFEVPIIVLPFPASHSMYDPADVIHEYGDGELKKADRVVVIGHLSLSGAKMGSESADMARGRAIEWPIAAIKEYWPDAIMVGGHYHRQQTCNGVIFPGSLARLGFDEETNEPGYLILEV